MLLPGRSASNCRRGYLFSKSSLAAKRANVLNTGGGMREHDADGPKRLRSEVAQKGSQRKKEYHDNSLNKDVRDGPRLLTPRILGD